MNRRKKGNQILKARAKKAKARIAPKNKPKYISKANRAKMELEENAVPQASADSGTQSETKP